MLLRITHNIRANADTGCVMLQELVVAAVGKREGEVGCVLCLGHNKGMEEAASLLAVSFVTANPF